MLRWIPFSTLILSLLVSGTAFADDLNGVGTLLSVQANTSSADGYLQFHGRAFVRNDDASVDEFRWGGVSCGSRVLSEAQLATLQAALSDKRMRIEVISQDGQGNAVCIVAFTLTPKQNLKFLP